MKYGLLLAFLVACSAGQLHSSVLEINRISSGAEQQRKILEFACVNLAQASDAKVALCVEAAAKYRDLRDTLLALSNAIREATDENPNVAEILELSAQALREERELVALIARMRGLA